MKKVASRQKLKKDKNLTHLHSIKTKWKLPLCLKSQSEGSKFDFRLILVELQFLQKGGKLGISG